MLNVPGVATSHLFSPSRRKNVIFRKVRVSLPEFNYTDIFRAQIGYGDFDQIRVIIHSDPSDGNLIKIEKFGFIAADMPEKTHAQFFCHP